MAAESGPVGMVVTLAIAGLLSGGILAGTYTAAWPRIERNQAEAMEAAISRVLPGTVSRRAFVLEGDAVIAYEGKPGTLPKGDAIYAGYDADGRHVGFAIPAAGSGFQDTIALIYGYDPARERIVGMEILRSLETPGLGDKIGKDPKWLGAFRDLAVEPEIKATKKGAAGPNEVDAISGATISSNAVVRIINQGNARWLDRLPAVETP